MKLKKPKPKTGEVIGSVVAVDLPSFPRPDFADDLRWPDDLTQLSAQNVSELIGKYTALLCYAQSLMSKFQQEILKLEALIDRHSIRMYIEEPQTIHLERWKRDIKIASDAGVFKLKARLTTVRACRDQAETHVKNYERQVNALSRELSRQTSTGDGYRFTRAARD